MGDSDIQQEWQQLRETYSLMSEDEICAVAGDAYDLTPIARQVLETVIRERGFKAEVRSEPPVPPDPEAEEDSELETLSFVQSREEAERTKSTLNAVFVPLFFGPDNVMEFEDFKGSFADGVEMKIRSVDRQRARFALARAEDADGNNVPDPEDDKEYAILCPRCRSENVILEASQRGKTNMPADSIFKWRCDACGHEWTDDGVAKPLSGH